MKPRVNEFAIKRIQWKTEAVIRIRIRRIQTITNKIGLSECAIKRNPENNWNKSSAKKEERRIAQGVKLVNQIRNNNYNKEARWNQELYEFIRRIQIITNKSELSEFAIKRNPEINWNSSSAKKEERRIAQGVELVTKQTRVDEAKKSGKEEVNRA